jgi:flavin-binding protein dodecin
MPTNRFVGHSKEMSVSGALEDAVQQAAAAQPGADRMVEFEVVNVRGRVGGIAGFRDVWVEISVGKADAVEGDKPKGEAAADDCDAATGDAEESSAETGHYTTMAVGEEGGESANDAPAEGEEEPRKYTTLAVGEEGGEAIGDPPAESLDPEGVKLEAAAASRGGDYTTLAVGEEGG